MASNEEELTNLAEQLEALLRQFVQSQSFGLFLETRYQATFQRLVLEAKTILDEEFQNFNTFSNALVKTVNSSSVGMVGGPSYAGVSESAQILRGAVNSLRRRLTKQPAAELEMHPHRSYVDPRRMAALSEKRGSKFDFSRLIALCGELNIASQHDLHHAVAMLIRAILDHVPPIFEQSTFAGVVAHHGGKSFKDQMKHLDGSLRHVADGHLHNQIRSRESLPNANQVDFRSPLDVLLAEIDRITVGSGG
jgi:hypothetical protein